MSNKKQQDQQQLLKWQQKYNILLQKNQSDLIKIRLREKQLNETIGRLQKQNEQIKNELSQKIKKLEKEVQMLKSDKQMRQKNKNRQSGTVAVSENSQVLANSSQIKSESAKQKDGAIQQNKMLRLEKQQLKSKLKDLESSIQTKLDENKRLNVLLLAQSQKDEYQKVKASLAQQQSRSQQLGQTIIHAQSKLTELQSQNIALKHKHNALQTQLAINQSQNTSQRPDFSHQLAQKLTLQTQVQRLRQLLTLTNTQYKNLAHKQQLKEELLVAKNQELNQLTQQLINLQQKAEKSKDFQDFRIRFMEEENKREQMEQESMLLKEMIKSHKTIMKIKENQVQRLKLKVNQLEESIKKSTSGYKK